MRTHLSISILCLEIQHKKYAKIFNITKKTQPTKPKNYHANKKQLKQKNTSKPKACWDDDIEKF